MLLNKKDLEKLKKIGASDILGLCLIAPKKYEDLFLYSYPKIGQDNAIEAEVIKIEPSLKQTKIKLFAKTLINI